MLAASLLSQLSVLGQTLQTLRLSRRDFQWFSGIVYRSCRSQLRNKLQQSYDIPMIPDLLPCDTGPSTKERLELSNSHWRLQWIRGRCEMDGELHSCDLQRSTRLGQSSSMTRKDRDLLIFDAGYFWIADTSNKMLERARTWHYMTSGVESYHGVLHCAPLCAGVHEESQSDHCHQLGKLLVEGIWRAKGERDHCRHSLSASLCQGPNWRQEAQGLTGPRGLSRTVNALRKSWNTGLIPSLGTLGLKLLNSHPW